MHMNFSYGTVAADKGSVVYIGSAPYGTQLTMTQLIAASTTKTTTDRNWSLVDYISKTSSNIFLDDTANINRLLVREQVVYFIIANPQQTIGPNTPTPIIGYEWRGNLTWMPDYTNTFTQGVANKKDPPTKTLVDINHVGGYPRSNLKPPNLPSFGIPTSTALSLPARKIEPSAIPTAIEEDPWELDFPKNSPEPANQQINIEPPKVFEPNSRKVSAWDLRRMERKLQQWGVNNMPGYVPYDFSNPPIKTFERHERVPTAEISFSAPPGLISERLGIATSGQSNAAAAMVDLANWTMRTMRTQ
jgi:hypothetical protein